MGFLTVAPLRGCGHKQAYASQLGVVLTVASSGAVDNTKLSLSAWLGGLSVAPSGAVDNTKLGLSVWLGVLSVAPSGAVDNVLFFENCYPDVLVLPYN